MEPRIFWSSDINVQLCATAAKFKSWGRLSNTLHSKSDSTKLHKKRSYFNKVQGASFEQLKMERIYRILFILPSQTVCIWNIWLGFDRDWIARYANWGWWNEEFYNLRNPKYWSKKSKINKQATLIYR